VIKIKEDSKTMANLLKAGYTMLNLACPVCNNPLFRNKSGDILCPICNRKVLIIDQNSALKQNNNKNPKILNNFNDKEKKNTTIFQILKGNIYAKINYINQLLEQEKNIDVIEKLTNTLIHLIKLVRKVDKLI
jgi:uncharacterized Zn finger protein (UPF0148 family)